MSGKQTDNQRTESESLSIVETEEVITREAAQPPDGVETEESSGPFGRQPAAAEGVAEGDDDPATKSDQDASAEETSGEVAESSDTEGDETTNGDDTAEQRPQRRSWRNRAKKLAKRLDEKDAEIGDLKQKLATLEKGSEDKAGAESRPNPEDFESHEDYTEALADWVYQRNARKAGGSDAPAPRRMPSDDHVLVQRYREEYQEEVAIGKEKYSDFEAVVQDPKLPLPPQVFRKIMESEKPAEVFYYLGKHPDVAAEIASLDESGIARRIGRIEAAVSGAKRPAAKEITQAPPVIQPSESSRSGDVNLETADMDSYIATRRRQERQRAR